MDVIKKLSNPKIMFTSYMDFDCIIFGTIELVIIFNNILVIVTICKTPKLRKISNIYIVNLAVADLLFGTNAIILRILMKYEFMLKFSTLVYTVMSTVIFSVLTVSVWSIVMISADRYLALTIPLHYKTVARKRAPIILSCLWIFSLFFSMTLILLESLIRPSDPSHFLSLPGTLYVIFVGFCLPTPLISYFYWKIFKIVISVNEAIRQTTLTTDLGVLRMHLGHTVVINEMSSNSNNDRVDSTISTFSSHQEVHVSTMMPRPLLKSTKAKKTISIVFGTFIVTCTPIYLLCPILLYFQPKSNAYIELFCKILLVANAALNPLIYALTKKNYRLEMKRIFLCS